MPANSTIAPAAADQELPELFKAMGPSARVTVPQQKTRYEAFGAFDMRDFQPLPGRERFKPDQAFLCMRAKSQSPFFQANFVRICSGKKPTDSES